MAELPRPAAEAPGLDHRRRPRRRGERLYAAVFDAVLAELADHGYGSFTVEAVASRAKVSKASLYRRWPGKRDLVLAAVQAALQDPDDLVDTGSLRGDLLAHFRQVGAHLHGPAGPALRGILGDVLGDPTSAAELYSAAHRGRSSEQLRIIARRAGTRGDLPVSRVEAFTARQLEAGLAILRHHYLWEGHLSESLYVQIVDEVVVPLFRHAGSGGDGVEEVELERAQRWGVLAKDFGVDGYAGGDGGDGRAGQEGWRGGEVGVPGGGGGRDGMPGVPGVLGRLFARRA